MGTGWSSDEAYSQSQANQVPSSTVSHGGDTSTKAQGPTTHNTPAMEPKPSEYKDKEELQHKPAADQVKLPCNYESILTEADSQLDKSSKDKLCDQLYAGVFLNQRRKIYWVDKKSNGNCFMLYARNLSISWGEDTRYWNWKNKKERDASVDVAELFNVCWLEVSGKFDATKLTPGVLYEVAFVLMLKDPAYGWEVPVNVRLTLPDGTKQEHKERMVEKLRGQWIEIPAGEFKALPEKAREIEFSLYEFEGGIWKRGLVVKGVTIRPKN